MSDITVTLDTEGLIVPQTDGESSFIAGFYSDNGLVLACGKTAEAQQGYIKVRGVDNWYKTLTDYYPVAYTGTAGSNHPHAGPEGTTLTGNWPNGPTAHWRHEWWAVHNYLRYGGTAIVGGTGSMTNTTSTVETLKNQEIELDGVFGGIYGQTLNDNLTAIASSRQDCVAICALGVTQDIGGDTSKVNLPVGTSGDKYTLYVAGQKLHLTTSQQFRVAVDEDQSLLQTTPLSADAAGCFARTDAVSNVWQSPAGFNRGRILDVVRLEQALSPTSASTLYNNKINPVRTFPGEGTFLFGDKTRRQASEHENFAYVNVTRLFILLRNRITQIARQTLFEINNDATRTRFVSQVVPILRAIQAAGGLVSYRIVCDNTNNTSTIVDNNSFVADIYIKPVKSIQTIRLRFTNKNDSEAINAEET